MIACASASARGTEVNSAAGLSQTRSACTAYVPGTTIIRPASSASRLKLPCGSSQVATRAAIMIRNSRTRVCGMRKRVVTGAVTGSE